MPAWAVGGECAHVGRRQPRGAGQVALGEYHDRLPGSDQGDEVGSVDYACSRWFRSTNSMPSRLSANPLSSCQWRLSVDPLATG